MVRCVCVCYPPSILTLRSVLRPSLLRRSSLTAFAQSIYSKETLDSSGEAARFGVADVRSDGATEDRAKN